MRVAFITTYKSSDVSAWSGSMFNMLGALLNAGVQVETIDALSDPYSAFFKAKRIVKNTVFGKNYLRDREPVTLRGYARQVEGRLRRRNPDIIFSAGTMPIAYLRTDKPIVFWADATFDGMINFYPEFTNLCDETIRNGHAMEQAALSNCRLAVYSSEWAAKTAIANYVVDSGKVKVVPYGANLSRFLSAEEVQRAITSRGSGVCKLLFVGIDWYRKGGEEALLVTSRLNQMGLDAELHVVGCSPPSPLPALCKDVRISFEKAIVSTMTLLSRLYRTSDFFILPSKAECAAVVVAEANSFGLPALTTNVGGMGTVVRDGKNGRAFDPSVFVQECADYILQTLSSKERYHQLCVSSFEEYSSRLNWDLAVHSVLNLIASEGIFEDVKSQKRLLREIMRTSLFESACGERSKAKLSCFVKGNGTVVERIIRNRAMQAMQIAEIIGIPVIITCSAFLLYLVDDGLGLGWTHNVVRNWQEFGLFNLHGQLVFNAGGFEATTRPEIFKGMSPVFLYLVYFATEIFGWTGLGTMSFHILLALAVFWATWELLGRNDFAFTTAIITILLPGYLRWQKILDPCAIPVLLSLPYIAIILPILKRPHLKLAPLAGLFAITLCFTSLNWSTAWVCGPCALLLWFLPAVDKRRTVLFVALFAASCVFLGVVSVLSKAGAAGTGSGNLLQFILSYTWGNVGYGLNLTTGTTICVWFS